MKAVVTGGCGFIGRFVADELLSRDYEVAIVDVFIDEEMKKSHPKLKFYKVDISQINNPQWDKIFPEVNAVFHLAGLLGTSELFSRIIEAECINVIGTINILEAARKHNVSKIIFTSKPNVWKYNVYTITKENCERYLDLYHNIYGIKSFILCPFNVYGPEEKIEYYRKAVPYFIISALKNEPIEIFGNGNQTMDLVFVEDVAKAIVTASETPGAVNKKIEIGSGVETKVINLAKKIIDMTNSTSEIKNLSMRKGEVPETHLCADIKTTHKIIGYTPNTSLEDGLKKTINHYKNNISKYGKIYKFKKEDML